MGQLIQFKMGHCPFKWASQIIVKHTRPPKLQAAMQSTAVLTDYACMGLLST